MILVDAISDIIQKVCHFRPQALHEPCFFGNEELYLKECLASTYVSSVGPFVDRFEAELAAYTGVKHVILVVNGTAALHISLKLAGVLPQDEVLLPALTFVATANAVTYCGATPHFIEVNTTHLGVDIVKLENYLNEITEIKNNECFNLKTGNIIRALIPMHTFGHPVEMDGICALAKKFHLTIIEDAAESLGSTYFQQHTGTIGRMGILSFNGNKTITTGGGGAILTNDTYLAQRAKHLTTTAKLPHPWEFNHDEIAYNYRMPNINAALGCAQLENLSSILRAKRNLFQQYEDAFREFDELKILKEPVNCQSNYWLQTMILNKSDLALRNEILQKTNTQGYLTRPIWTPLHHLQQFQQCPAMDLEITNQLQGRVINLPSTCYNFFLQSRKEKAITSSLFSV